MPIAATLDTNRRWRSLLLFTALVLIAWTLRATVLYAIDEAIVPPWRKVYSDIVKAAIMVVLPVLYLAYIDRVVPSRAIECRLPPSRRAWAAGGLWIAASLMLGAGGALLSGGSLAGVPAHGLAGLAAIFIATVVSPICEEVLFRGFFLHQYAARCGWWKANVIQAGLFAAVHAPYWLTARGLNGAVLHDLLAVALFGWLMGFALRHSRSLIICIVAHILYNAIQAALQMPPVE